MDTPAEQPPVPQQLSPQPLWKRLKLPLERPYKDDDGNPIPVLLDITPEGERIYEAKETSATRLETNLRRIFLERGVDFFDRADTVGIEAVKEATETKPTNAAQDDTGDNEETNASTKPMTSEELFHMRAELIPHLYVALGEMRQAQALLASLLPSSRSENNPLAAPQHVAMSTDALSSTMVSNPAEITSLQAFNAQLVLGSKDESLRAAASVFRQASESMERGHARSEKYWLDALKARQSNWGLVPAPLPFGSATGKLADKTAKDFIISFGLEGSPTAFRRRAIAQLTDKSTIEDDLEFPMHQKTRLQIGLTFKSNATQTSFSYVSPTKHDGQHLDRSLQAAQTEIVDQEIFALLVRDAANLPAVPSRVSERFINIDAALGVELTFSLVDSAHSRAAKKSSLDASNLCELIYHALRVLLIRGRGDTQQEASGKPAPSILQPIVDLLQYRSFCALLKDTIGAATTGLVNAGIPSTMTFTAVGESGEDVVSLLTQQTSKVIGGEAVLRISNWSTMRWTFTAPSSLVAHPSEAALVISSLPLLSQMLKDEIQKRVYQKICSLMKQNRPNDNWFIDLNQCVGKWEGCMIKIHIEYEGNSTVNCTVLRLDESTGHHGVRHVYPHNGDPLISWISNIVTQTRSARA